MQSQTLKSITISGITITETAEGNTATLSIGDQITTFTREDFDKLYEVRNEFLSKNTTIKCSVCGQEMAGTYELTEKTAVVSVEPCQTCARKEPLT